MTFNVLMVGEDKQTSIQAITEAELPDGDVIVDIDYSTLNYKDGLGVTNKSPIFRLSPMVPGIDFAGTVSHSDNPQWSQGDKVILNGWGVGETHWGGLAQKARVKGEWLIRLPEGFTSRQAMAIGTAGYTSMLAVMALQDNGVNTDQGEILVTGANGGVGSIAIWLLSKLGYTVVVSTGRNDQKEYLTQLGATEIIHRDELSGAGKPLLKERWAGVIDCVGSHTLANACAGTRYGGTVAACGLAQGMDFPATVMPFILRGVKLIGIESVYASSEKRQQAWNRLAELLSPEVLEQVTTEIALGDVVETCQQLIDGKVRGRVVVDVNN